MRSRILAAAAQEMNERGMKFTVDAVARQLGISKKTVYQHFSSKHEIVISITDAVLADIKEQNVAIMASSGSYLERLAAILIVQPQIFGPINYWVLEDVKRLYPVEWEKIERCRREKVTYIARLLEEGMARGEIREINIPVATEMWFLMVGELLNYRFLAENNLTFGDALSLLRDIFLHGVLKSAQERVGG